MPNRLILACHLCPGDVMTLTAAVESLHRQFPGEYETDVRTSAREIWEHNPRITKISVDPGVRVIDMHYPSIGYSNQVQCSFLDGYTRFLGEQLEIPLRLQVNRPCVYLSENEKVWVNQIREHVTNERDVPFWLVCAGIKNDFTAKSWPVEYYQRVVDETRGRIQWAQIGSAEHKHPPLTGVIDMRGKTNTRQFLRLVHHCKGGLGPVTFLQHACAAFEKPYVCLLGGREPVTWVQYPLQHTMHTMGMLDCCRTEACWASRVAPLRDKDTVKNEKLCKNPMYGLKRPSPKCMEMIKPEHVVEALSRWMS